MRVMLDTNVLISAILFPGRRLDEMMRCIFEEHHLVLSSFVLDELFDVIERKFPGKRKAVDDLLAVMSYELVYTPRELEPGLLRSGTRRTTPYYTRQSKRTSMFWSPVTRISAVYLWSVRRS